MNAVVTGPRWRPAAVLRLGAVVAALLLALVLPGTDGAWTARVTGTTNTAGASAAFTCAQAARGATLFAAGPAASVTYPMGELVGTAVADVASGLQPGTYSSTGISYAQDGPCLRDAGTAVTLDGTGSIAGPVLPSAPLAFSEEVWFRTTVGGGQLVGSGSSRTGPSMVTDRQLLLDANGHVVLGVLAGGAMRTVRSAVGHLDARWHHVVGTYDVPGSANPGLRLYVDGVLVAADPSVVVTTPTAGYWRMGYDAVTGWPGASTSPSYKGSLAWASLYLSALTPAQVQVHHTAGISPAGLRGRHSFMSVTVGDNYHLRHYGFVAYVSHVTTATPDPVWRDDATFAVVAGLADPSCASFRSVNYPTHYLRHYGFQVRLDPRDGSAGFDADATFCQRPSTSGRGTSWSSYNFPTRYLRVFRNGTTCAEGPDRCGVYIASNGGPNTFDTATNWAAETSWVVNSPVSP